MKTKIPRFSLVGVQKVHSRFNQHKVEDVRKKRQNTDNGRQCIGFWQMVLVVLFIASLCIFIFAFKKEKVVEEKHIIFNTLQRVICGPSAHTKMAERLVKCLHLSKQRWALCFVQILLAPFVQNALQIPCCWTRAAYWRSLRETSTSLKMKGKKSRKLKSPRNALTHLEREETFLIH